MSAIAKRQSCCRSCWRHKAMHPRRRHCGVLPCHGSSEMARNTRAPCAGLALKLSCWMDVETRLSTPWRKISAPGITGSGGTRLDTTPCGCPCTVTRASRRSRLTCSATSTSSVASSRSCGAAAVCLMRGDPTILTEARNVMRRLAVGTTLTLVNGQRQGATGYQGSFVDVSSIPASAVERIEILPEGASALYGADAIGGVVNVILRKDFEGFEARVRASTAGGDATERTSAGLWGHAGPDGHALLGFQYDDSRALACSARTFCAANGDFRRFGGRDLRGVGGNPGTILDLVTGVPIAAIPRGQDGSNLTATQLVPGTANYTNSVIDNDILPQQKMRSVFLSAAYILSRHWELSVDRRYSSREFNSTFPQPTGAFLVPASNAFNHLGGPVLVAYGLTADVGPVVDNGRTATSFISTGIKGVLPRGWQLRLSTAYSKSSTRFFEYNNLNTGAIDVLLASADPATALNLFGDGSHTARATLAALRNQSVALDYPDEFTTAMASVIADGTLFTGPAGPIRFAGGGDFRRGHSVGLSISLSPESLGRDAAAGFG